MYEHHFYMLYVSFIVCTEERMCCQNFVGMLYVFCCSYTCQKRKRQLAEVLDYEDVFNCTETKAQLKLFEKKAFNSNTNCHLIVPKIAHRLVCKWEWLHSVAMKMYIVTIIFRFCLLNHLHAPLLKGFICPWRNIIASQIMSDT